MPLRVRVAWTLAVLSAPMMVAGEDGSVWDFPDDLWDAHRQHFGCAERQLGYTSEEMANFPTYPHRLPVVDQLFADACALPSWSGEMGEALIACADEPREVINRCFDLLDASPVDDSPPLATIELHPMDDASRATWQALPDDIRELVADIVAAAASAKKPLHGAFDWEALIEHAGVDGAVDLTSPQVYDYAAAPWTRYGEPCPASFQAFDTLDRDALATAGSTFLAHMQPVLAQASRWSPDMLDDTPIFTTCRLRTPIGNVCILGPGDDRYEGNDPIIIDLGGNDTYVGRIAVPRSKEAPVGLVLDLGGDDTYDGGEEAASLACGLFGIGAIFDLTGDDIYTCGESGIGCAWHGIGLVVDIAGDDSYTTTQIWGQGVAHAGVAALIDLAGNDSYMGLRESQGVGSTLGIGLLLDAAGNDTYHVMDNEEGRTITEPAAQTKAHESSMCQGAGYGRRADTADKLSLSGGVGMLIDGGGDDSYYGGVFSQGVGYWWSLGFLTDLGGNDIYRGVYYAQGASAHYALAAFVDLTGDDTYNDRDVMSQTLGNGRDGAIATFFDGSGDDIYHVPDRSGGEGDITGIGLFWDRRGDDTYRILMPKSMGAATPPPGWGGFRDTMPTIGVFLDTAGNDTYPQDDKPGNNRCWWYNEGPVAWGYGLDTELDVPGDDTNDRMDDDACGRKVRETP